MNISKELYKRLFILVTFGFILMTSFVFIAIQQRDTYSEYYYNQGIMDWKCKISTDINIDSFSNEYIKFKNTNLEIELPCNQLTVNNILTNTTIKGANKK